MRLFPVPNGSTILVIGDLMLDELVRVRTKPTTHEPTKFAVIDGDAEDTLYTLGGAGNVAVSVADLGFSVRLFTCRDRNEEVRQAVKRAVGNNKLLSIEGPIEDIIPQVSRRRRTVSDGRVLLRSDRDFRITPENAEKAWIAFIKRLTESPVSAVIVSDYGRGLLADMDLVENMNRHCRARNIPVIVDSKVPESRCGASFVKLSESEFWHYGHNEDLRDVTEMTALAMLMVMDNQIDGLAVTLGHRGVLTATPTQRVMVEPYGDDETSHPGTGDVFTAALAVCLANKVDFIEAVEEANYVAGVSVSSGSVVKTADGLKSWLRRGEDDWSHKIVYHDEGDDSTSVVHLRRLIRSAGNRLVFTNGCFDLLHAGHVDGFRQMKGEKDILVVSLAGDDLVRKLKGESRPIFDWNSRASMLAACQDVDAVVRHNSDAHLAWIINRLNPDEIVKGDDWAGKEVVGGAFRTVPRRINISTSAIIEKIRS